MGSFFFFLSEYSTQQGKWQKSKEQKKREDQKPAYMHMKGEGKKKRRLGTCMACFPDGWAMG